MSSKSKKSSRKGGSGPKHVDPAGPREAAAAHPSTKLGPVEISDDIVHVPKNKSPLFFVLMIALLILLLIIFLVPDAIQSTFGQGGDEDETYVGWRGPDGDEVELGYLEFRNQKRLLVLALEVDPFLGGVLGADGRNLSDEQLARFLILDQLAVASGLHVSDTDLIRHLQELARLYGGVANYKAMVQRAGTREPEVEETIRRILRASRYLQVTALMAGVPDPARIEELWNEDHEELSLDLAWVDAADLEDEARAELPSDEELATWYAALDPGRQEEFQEPERRSAEVVSFTDPAATPGTGLLAAFPEVTPEGETPVPPEERTRQYYDQVYFWHFLAPSEPDADGNRPQSYVTFEEAQERAALEAPVYFAMQRWLSALRESPEPVDLAAKAAEYGLAYESLPLSSREELRDRERHKSVGDTFATRVFQTNTGELAYSVVARSDALSIVRTGEVVEGTLKPFEEVRERVAELWVKERADALAQERCKTLRDSLASEPPSGEADHEEVEGEQHDHRYAQADAFRTAAEAAGASVATRGWMDRGAEVVPTDPALDAATNAFLRRQRQLAALADDEVTEPLSDPASKRVYLVRLAGRRPVPIDRLSPDDLQNRYEPGAALERRRAMLAEPSIEYLEKQFGLYFVRPEGAEEQAEEQAEEPAAG